MFIRTEMRIKFARVYFLTNSEVVLAMLQKESSGFHSYAAVRIGEIQQCTQLDDWYWIESQLNIADWISRGKVPNQLNKDSPWQNGPDILKLDENDWPIKQECKIFTDSRINMYSLAQCCCCRR